MSLQARNTMVALLGMDIMDIHLADLSNYGISLPPVIMTDKYNYVIIEGSVSARDINHRISQTSSLFSS